MQPAWSGRGCRTKALGTGSPRGRVVTGWEVSCPGERLWGPLGPDQRMGFLSNPFSASPLRPQVSLLEELLSPLLTPLFLLFWFCPRALEIIDFFHHFTVDVAGVGDICSFALMDVQRHGHPQVRALFRLGEVVGRWEFAHLSQSRAGCHL